MLTYNHKWVYFQKPMSEPMTLTAQLRKAIRDSGLSLYRIAKDSGVPYAVLQRFANADRQIKMAAADKLAEYFGMRLTKPRRVSPT